VDGYAPRDGSYKTAWRRLKKWQEMSIWDRIFRALASIGPQIFYPFKSFR
jgi:hypothetical protein